MKGQKRILIIDDDMEICDFVEDLLSFRFSILKATTAAEGLHKVQTEEPDLIILDLKLQNQSGLDICKTLRESPQTQHLPILVYSGSEDPEELTKAFDFGADDFVGKTARPRELVARILSKIRRIEEREEDPELITCGNLILNTRKLEATINEKAVQLSVLEFNLLRFFVEHQDCVVSRTQILEGVWKDAVVSNRTIDTHMVYLRKKLEGFDHVLATVYGAGYILRGVSTSSWHENYNNEKISANDG